MAWLREVKKDGKTPEGFANSGKGFKTLDRKLCDALMRTIQGELLRTIDLLKNKMMAETGAMLRGRQVLFEIYRHLSTSANSTNLYTMSEFMHLDWFGDDKMEAFRNAWDQRTTNAVGIIAPMDTA